MASDLNDPVYFTPPLQNFNRLHDFPNDLTPSLQRLQNFNRLHHDSIATFRNDNDPTAFPVFFRSSSLRARAETIGIGGVGMYRTAAGLLNVPRIPVELGSGRRALQSVVGDNRRTGSNITTRQLFEGLSTPRAIGQTTNSQLPTTEENSRITLDEQEKALGKLKKTIYNPGPKRFARRLSLYYRNNAMGDIKEMENEDEDGKRCAVCLEDLEPGEQVAITPCIHMFHEGCIVPWLKSHGKCPVCRFAL